MKKSLIYIAAVNVEDKCSGISRKVLTQFAILSKQYDATLFGYGKSGLVMINHENSKNIIISQNIHRRIALINEVKKYCNNKNITYAYIRRMPCNIFVISMLKTLKKHTKKILWEIPTYPYDNEKMPTIMGKLSQIFDKIFRHNLKQYIDRIVTFSLEENIFGIDTINTGNGVDVDSIKTRKVRKQDDVIRFIAVAVLNDWHGYDRLINGIANYNGQQKIEFHLVGDGPCYKQYVDLANKLKVEDKVMFYGSKTKEEIDDIYDKCDIAVESLGWHRSHVKVGTSIKTREYVAKGMPILASSIMDIFPNGWEYAYYSPIDDSPIDLNEVVKFYENLIKNKSPNKLANEIRKIAYEKCDMNCMMKPIIDFYEGK